MSTISKDIMAAIALANDSYKGGYDEGWRAGVKAGVAACRRIAEGEDMDKVIGDVLAQGKTESEVTK